MFEPARGGEHRVPEAVSLRTMRAGEIGLVTALRGSSAASRRLAEFGLVRGATVEVIRAGAPCIVRIDHTRLSMGASLQEHILLARLT